MTTAPRLSVVVLSYERVAYLRQALDALASQVARDDEILVVDNASPSREAIDAVLAGHPAVRLVRPSANLGFTGGMNLGLQSARGAYVLLTEDDLVLEPGCLTALLQCATGAPDDAIVAGVMVDHGTTRVRAAGGELALGPPLTLRLVGAGQDVTALPTEPYDVTFLPGGFLLARRTTFEALGGFRAAYFMYFEDVELCLRARRRGVRLVMVPAARVTHLPPIPVPGATNLKYHMVKNMLATYLLHAPLRRLPAVAARYGLREGVGRLRAGRVEFVPFVRAWLWTIAHAPALLAERARSDR